MNRFVPLAAFLSLVLASAVAADTPQGPAADVPELQVLDHWAGKWDVDMTVKPSGMRGKGTATGEWVLNGQFLRQTAALEEGGGLPASQLVTLMGYDRRQKVYRSWTFHSTGLVSFAEGTWDARTRTMTSTSRDADNGITTTIKATFPEDGVENWSFTSKDRDGKVVSEITGKNTRRKK